MNLTNHPRIFSLAQCRTIRKEYENGSSSTQLSKRYGASAVVIIEAIRRAKGDMRGPQDCHLRFSIAQSLKLKREYENGFSSTQLAKKYKVSSPGVIVRAIRYGGGKIRPANVRNRLFFRDPIRERHLSNDYQLRAEDMDWMFRRQKGLCLWCLSSLPQDSLKCVVDHIRRGQRKGLSNRKKVRGLCCPDNVCNQLAGRIEAGKISKVNWGFLTAFVKRVHQVLKTNKGNLSFPREMGA